MSSLLVSASAIFIFLVIVLQVGRVLHNGFTRKVACTGINLDLGDLGRELALTSGICNVLSLVVPHSLPPSVYQPRWLRGESLLGLFAGERIAHRHDWDIPCDHLLTTNSLSLSRPSLVPRYTIHIYLFDTIRYCNQNNSSAFHRFAKTALQSTKVVSEFLGLLFLKRFVQL